jgi:DNA excision repair protein ERCC-2
VEWPITPRPGQRETAERLAEFIEQGLRVLFSAPVGWGKTHAVLAALKEAEAMPTAWLVRSLALGNRIAEDAALWGLVAFTAAGREKMCPLAPRLGSAVHDFCRFAKFKCRYAKLARADISAADWRELKETAEREGFCPYYAQDLVYSDVIVQNYNKPLRRWVRALVVDEAHNLALPEERALKISQLAEAVANARMHVSARTVKALESLIQYTLVKDGDLDIFLDEEARGEILRHYHELLVENPERARALHPLVTLLNAVAAYVEGDRISVFRPPRVPLFRPAILMTATPLLPLPTRIDAEVRVPWERKVPALIISDVSSKFEEFDTRMVLKYKRLLVTISTRARRVLLFAASERVAKELRSWVTYEETTPPPDWEGVLMLRARGRFSEGVDIEADAVIIAGAPYLPPEVAARLARFYKTQGYEEPTKLAVDAPMLATVLQCLGRAWRDPEKEPPRAYLADWRFERYREQLREWMDITKECSTDELDTKHT